MNDRDFVYWLQGFAEMNGGPPNDTQWEIIRAHIKLTMDNRLASSAASLTGGGISLSQGLPYAIQC